MTEGNRKFAIIVGALAAATGVAVASYFFYSRSRSDDTPRLRTVTDVLTDCYGKLSDLRERLADLGPNLQRTSERA